MFGVIFAQLEIMFQLQYTRHWKQQGRNMTIQESVRRDDWVEIIVSGVIKKSELDEFRITAKQSVENGHNKILVILQDFGGWGDNSENWSDISLAEELDEYLQGMAIVGEPQWKNSVELFTLKGLRGFPIEYFSPEEEEAARSWLKERA